MDLFTKYHKSKSWYEKVTLIEVHHNVNKNKEPGWTISQTASYFNLSIGLVSENLSLAEAIHTYPELINCESRADALKKFGQLIRVRRKYGSNLETPIK